GQEFDSLVGSAGWQVAYTIHEDLRPYARVTVDREFEDEAAQAFARSQSIADSLPYAVPGVVYDQSWVTLSFGARTRLFGREADIGASVNRGEQGGKHAMVYAGAALCARARRAPCARGVAKGRGAVLNWRLPRA